MWTGMGRACVLPVLHCTLRIEPNFLSNNSWGLLSLFLPFCLDLVFFKFLLRKCLGFSASSAAFSATSDSSFFFKLSAALALDYSFWSSLTLRASTISSWADLLPIFFVKFDLDSSGVNLPLAGVAAAVETGWGFFEVYLSFMSCSWPREVRVA